MRYLLLPLLMLASLSAAQEKGGVYVTMAGYARNPKLRDELLQMEERDIAAHKSKEGSAEVERNNTFRLREIVSAQGWPTILEAGDNGSHAAWLIAKHSKDIEFQKRCLKLMAELLDQRQAGRAEFADRKSVV